MTVIRWILLRWLDYFKEISTVLARKVREL